MKVLVDLPNEFYEDIKKKRDNGEYMHSINYLILMGDEIPDDATNGDVIVSIFHDCIFFTIDEYVHDCIFFTIDEYVIVKDREGKQMFKASKTWWNSKYDETEEEESSKDGE